MSARKLAALLMIPFFAAVAGADEDKINLARRELEPRLVRLVGDMSLSEALKSLEKQTGNTVVDRRRAHRDNPKLKLDLQNVTFWQAVDNITAQARCNYSPYQEEGALALVDGTPRQPNAAYFGICRLAVKRVSVTLDVDSGLRYCVVQPELAWEPRFQPIYFDVETVDVQFAAETPRGKPTTVSMKGPGLTKLEDGGAGAVEFDLRLPAPPRACPSIESLSARIRLIGPAKMLTFRLADIKTLKNPVEQTQDGVSVAFKPDVQGKEWSFHLDIRNPPGAHKFESNQFKDWMMHNRIHLEKVDGTRAELASSQPGNVTFERTQIRYDFDNRPPKTVGWSLVYRTPGRVVDLPVSFTLKNVALP